MPNNVNSLENFRTEELPPEPQFPSWLNMLASNLGHAMLNLLSPTETSLADPPTQIDLKPIIYPYHTHPVSHPSQFHLEVDPKSANNRKRVDKHFSLLDLIVPNQHPIMIDSLKVPLC
jgi:hypothetical protein